MSFDAATNAALLAALTARAVSNQFTFVTRAATAKDPAYIDHPIASRFRPVSLGYAQRSIVSWNAVYRSPSYNVPNPDGSVAYVTGGLQRTFGLPYGMPPTLQGLLDETVVCDTSNLLIAQGMLLQWAKQQFDLFDQRSKAANLVPQMH